MTFIALLRQPSGFIPLLLSAAAFALIVGVLTTVGITHPADERLPARVFQLLMLVQAPIIAAFAWKWVPQSPRTAGVVLTLQIGAAVAAIATIAWLESGGSG